MTLPSPGDIARSATTAGRPADRLMAEAVVIIDTARDYGVQLRLTGGLAVRRYATDLAFMDREFSDIDFIGRSRESAGLQRALAKLGYEENRHVGAGHRRRASCSTRSPPGCSSRAPTCSGAPHPSTANRRRDSVVDHIDIFLDVMRMDHDVDVRGRLGIDPYAISPADILLTKLQIGELAAEGRARRDRPAEGPASRARQTTMPPSTAAPRAGRAPATGASSPTSTPTSRR